ncbi:hypothetical protein CEXT_26381 [Caerostris extrusa]|uniref:Uncharacterized protein n=1 Tax=Caerostris extrusa TaxID=172846 RepID=A0AAV4VCM4_CAEEX|nr:hypothetical protein CEXT_26381 [Caerostris extrusa]
MNSYISFTPILQKRAIFGASLYTCTYLISFQIPTISSIAKSPGPLQSPNPQVSPLPPPSPEAGGSSPSIRSLSILFHLHGNDYHMGEEEEEDRQCKMSPSIPIRCRPH